MDSKEILLSLLYTFKAKVIQKSVVFYSLFNYWMTTVSNGFVLNFKFRKVFQYNYPFHVCNRVRYLRVFAWRTYLHAISSIFYLALEPHNKFIDFLLTVTKIYYFCCAIAIHTFLVNILKNQMTIMNMEL